MRDSKADSLISSLNPDQAHGHKGRRPEHTPPSFLPSFFHSHRDKQVIRTHVAPGFLFSLLYARGFLSLLPGPLPELKRTTLPVVESQADLRAADRKPSTRTGF